MTRLPDSLPRSNIGHYRIIEKLGEGGMGEVYKAEDTLLKRLVAIKLLLRRHALDDEQGRLRFLQEARAASALNHPNIVQVHEFNSHEGEDFIVMEYVQGKTLSRLCGSGASPLTKCWTGVARWRPYSGQLTPPEAYTATSSRPT